METSLFRKQNKFILIIYQKKKEMKNDQHCIWVNLSYCFESREVKWLEYILESLLNMDSCCTISLCQIVGDVCHPCEETKVVYILDDPPKRDSSSFRPTSYSSVHYCDHMTQEQGHSEMLHWIFTILHVWPYLISWAEAYSLLLSVYLCDNDIISLIISIKTINYILSAAILKSDDQVLWMVVHHFLGGISGSLLLFSFDTVCRAFVVYVVKEWNTLQMFMPMSCKPNKRLPPDSDLWISVWSLIA